MNARFNDRFFCVVWLATLVCMQVSHTTVSITQNGMLLEWTTRLIIVKAYYENLLKLFANSISLLVCKLYYIFENLSGDWCTSCFSPRNFGTTFIKVHFSTLIVRKSSLSAVPKVKNPRKLFNNKSTGYITLHNTNGVFSSHAITQEN